MPVRVRPPAARPEALSSDIWYTLVYLRTTARRELHRGRRRVWAEPLLRAGMTRARVQRSLDEHATWKERVEAQGRTPPLRTQVRWLERRTGVRVEAPAISERLDRALLRAPVRTAPGAVETVRELSSDGVPLAVVSNILNESAEATRTVLDRAGLLRWFRVVYLSCDHPFAKPRPEPFYSVARFLGIRPAGLVHVGDLGYDLQGARRAGATGWLFVEFADLNRHLAGRVGASSVGAGRRMASWTAVARAWRKRRRD